MGNKQSSQPVQNPPPSGILEFHPIEPEKNVRKEKYSGCALRKLHSWCSRIRAAAVDAVEEATECDPYTFATSNENKKFVEGGVEHAGNTQSTYERESVVISLHGHLQGMGGEEEEEEEEEEEKVEEKKEKFATKSATTNTRTTEEVLYNTKFVPVCPHSRKTSVTWIENEEIQRPIAVKPKCRTSDLLGKEAPVPQIPNLKPTADASDRQKSWATPSHTRGVSKAWLEREEFARHADAKLKDINACLSVNRAPVARTQIMPLSPSLPDPLSYARVTSSSVKISEPTTANQNEVQQDLRKPKTEIDHSYTPQTAVTQEQHNETVKPVIVLRRSGNENSQRKTDPVQHERPATQVKETSAKKRINPQQRTGSWNENTKPVKRVLTSLRYMTQGSSSRQATVDRFLAQTKKALERMDCEIMKNCTFSPAGSSFEGTAINKSADFDMLLILPQPYRGDNFKALESKYPGYFKLQWKKAIDYENHYGYEDDDDYYDEDEDEDYDEYDEYEEYDDDADFDDYFEDDDEYDGYDEYGRRDCQEVYYDFDEYEDYEDSEECHEDYWDENGNVDFDDTDWPKYVRDDGILKTWELLQYIFKRLEIALNEVSSIKPEWKLTYRPQFTSFIAFLKDSDGSKLKVDIVPQIGQSLWKGLPGLRSPVELSSPFQKCVSDGSVQYPIFFSLVPAPYMLKQDGGKCLVTTAFSMMERHCLQASDVVRHAVIFAKLLSKNHGWKKSFGLRPFHMKRVAAKHFEELNDLPTWNAFLKLLEYLSAELRNGGIDGYFIKKQKVFTKAVRVQLAEEIGRAKTNVTPNNLTRKVNNNG